MLKHLHIANYALIDNLDIDFHNGFNIITGETGAGKSIMLSALSLLFGARCDSKSVQHPGVKSVIEAVFENPPVAVKAILENADIDHDPHQVILRREISPAGRSRAFINDTPTDLQLLRELSVHLLDIHSQHKNQLLASPTFQLQVIDTLAANADLLSKFASQYATLRSSVKQLKALKAELKQSATDAEYLRYQLSQINEVNPTPGEEIDLEAEREVAKAAIDNFANIAEASQLLGVSQTAVTQLRAALEKIASSLPEGDTLDSRLANIDIELADISSAVDTLRESTHAEPADIEYIDTRLQAIKQLCRTLNVANTTELEAMRQNLTKRLDALNDAPHLLAEAEQAARKALATARATAEEISIRRHQAATHLQQELCTLAKPLGMKNLQCDIRVSGADISSTGIDNVEFLFAFNKNQPLTPVAGSASGGEISRIMLCLKAIIARHMQLPSLLFDEVDTGVSGQVAAQMGSLMQGMAHSMQLIVITHLPQVAACGEHHYKVYKHDDDIATRTRISQLSPEQRIDELAVMLGGSVASQAARENAISLLENAHGKE